jgi:ABC-type xylose transport system permease subunit
MGALGSEGTVFGAVVGALIMQSLSNRLQMMNVSSKVKQLIRGLVLVLAVLTEISMKKKKPQREPRRLTWRHPLQRGPLSSPPRS